MLELLNLTLSNLDPQSIVHQFEVNALSPLCCVHTLLSKLSKSAKIALISSRMGSIEDNNSGGSMDIGCQKLLYVWLVNLYQLI